MKKNLHKKNYGRINWNRLIKMYHQKGFYSTVFLETPGYIATTLKGFRNLKRNEQ